MAITTKAQEYKRLRSYLNPYFKGPKVNAILNALASGSSSYLVNSAAAVNDSLYITTASGTYLAQRLADYGIVKPDSVGISDELFRLIGIQVKNRKQVRDLINNILNIIFGDEFVKASNKSGAFEPYSLDDGDNLIINYDDNHTVNVTFKTAQFVNIAAATAQEVADVISTTLSNLKLTGIAIRNNDGNGNYVELISSTIGPASSVTVEGGSAQNQLLFPSIVAAGGNLSTQWTLSLISPGLVRFTWTGGANPNLQNVSVGNYVNIFGGGFASSANEGTYSVFGVVGGTVGSSYFEVPNALGTTGVVTQGVDDAILFYSPVRKTLASLKNYAAVYQPSAKLLQIFLPATTQIINRTRIGSAHIHYPPNVVYDFSSNVNVSDQFAITTATTLVAGTDFAIGLDIPTTIKNMVTVIDAISGLDAVFSNDQKTGRNLLTVFQDIPSLTLVGTYTGSASITGSGLIGDPVSVQPNQQGPYSYDLAQPFTVGDVETTLTQELDSSASRVIQIANAQGFPDVQGYIIFEYGTENQEGPVPYIGRPSSDTLLLSPLYTIKKQHPPGSNVSWISQNSPVVLTKNGTDWAFYLTDTVSGRVYAENLIKSVAATGINIVFTVLYPDKIGLGGWQNPVIDEIAYVYGDDSILP